MFGMFAGIYHGPLKCMANSLNNTLAYIHFWVTMAGAYLIFWPMHYEGLAVVCLVVITIIASGKALNNSKG
jgi:cytochrome c oxidase subunit 1